MPATARTQPAQCLWYPGSMAIFRPGPLVGAISGPVGGVDFVAASKGTIVRQRRRRTIPSSPRLQRSQTRFTQNTRLWSRMEPSTRNAWDSAAAGFTLPNRLGQHVHLSGFQLFMKYRPNSNFPPDATNFLPPSLATQPSMLYTTAEVFDGGPFNIQLTPIAPTAYITINVSGSRPFTNRPRKFLRYRSINFGYGPITNFVDIWTFWTTEFGIPAIGETVAVRIIPTRGGFIDPPPVDSILTVQP